MMSIVRDEDREEEKEGEREEVKGEVKEEVKEEVSSADKHISSLTTRQSISLFSSSLNYLIYYHFVIHLWQDAVVRTVGDVPP